ncbi:MAG TPA: 4-hydroxy-tetrahydrodipicolinate reductase [Methanobacteriaceae archaeon]|nr:4-hydroxy-tetrahydrodipicolinate reductase [Methanobacteriaceae archaeon]
MIDVAVTGAGGRMGSKIIKTILQQDEMRLVAAIEAPQTLLEGKDVGEVIGVGKIGVNITGADQLEITLKKTKPNVLVDFTIANAAVNTIQTAAATGVNLVVGTTGFDDQQMETIKNAVDENNIAAVISSNMAIGVNVFFKLVEELAGILSDYDVEIIEAHHHHKRDAPSGTAVTAFELIAQRLERTPDDVGVYGRQGLVGERTQEEIGVHAVRGGDIVGDHTVIFAGEGERLEIIHRAHSRQVFVSGVIKALKYVVGAPKGKISDMGDVLGLKE